MEKKQGIPLGFLWGMVIILIYVYSFFGFGFYLVWNTKMPVSVAAWLAIIGSSILYLIAGIVCFVPILLIALYFTLRDRNLIQTVKNHWPILAAIVYSLIPNVPGPIDEVIVGGIAASLEGYFLVRRRLIAGDGHQSKPAQNLLQDLI